MFAFLINKKKHIENFIESVKELIIKAFKPGKSICTIAAEFGNPR